MKALLAQLPAWRNRLASLQTHIAKIWQNLAPLRTRAWASLQSLAPLKARLLVQWQCFTTNAKPIALKAWEHLRHHFPRLTVTHFLLVVIALLLVVNLFRNPSSPSPIVDASTLALAPSSAPDPTLATRRLTLESEIRQQESKLSSLRASKEDLESDRRQQQLEVEAYSLKHFGVLAANAATTEGFKAANNAKLSEGEQVAGAIIGIIGLANAFDNGTATLTVQADYEALQGKVTATDQKIANLQRQITQGETVLANLNRELAALKP